MQRNQANSRAMQAWKVHFIKISNYFCTRKHVQSITIKPLTTLKASTLNTQKCSQTLSLDCRVAGQLLVHGGQVVGCGGKPGESLLTLLHWAMMLVLPPRQKGQECVFCSLPERQEENTDRQNPAFHLETLARLSWLWGRKQVLLSEAGQAGEVLKSSFLYACLAWNILNIVLLPICENHSLKPAGTYPTKIWATL